MDAATVLALGESIIKISVVAFAAFRQAAAENGADATTLTALDLKYEARLEHERQIAEGDAHHNG